MPDRSEFSYEGNVRLIAGKQSLPASEVIVTGIRHMLPVSVSCMIDGRESELTAYIDYKSSHIDLPRETSDALGGGDDILRQAILDHLYGEEAEATRQHDEMYGEVIER